MTIIHHGESIPLPIFSTLPCFEPKHVFYDNLSGSFGDHRKSLAILIGILGDENLDFLATVGIFWRVKSDLHVETVGISTLAELGKYEICKQLEGGYHIDHALTKKQKIIFSALKITTKEVEEEARKICDVLNKTGQ